MCTCITYENGGFYFGRNMDIEYSFGEQVVITPRNYEFRFKKMPAMIHHYAMIGMAAVADNYPLYAEAVNEKGLGIAGLNFPGNACYCEEMEGKKNITPYELIPWLLGQCATVDEVEKILQDISILESPFAENMPLAPLHWMIADKNRTIVLESVKEGMHIFDNPYGVLTNNPQFPYYEIYLHNFLNLTCQPPQNHFADGLDLQPYGQGMGAIGLPGDFSPASRFVKTAFLKWNSQAPEDELPSVSQVFHILDSVGMVRGAVITPEGKADITTYSCCVNMEKGIYYYKTYDNSQIQAVSMVKEDLESRELKCYSLKKEQQICWQN